MQPGDTLGTTTAGVERPSPEAVGPRLERVVAAALELVDGCTAAGITLLDGTGGAGLACAGATAAVAGAAEGRLRSGPCYGAILDRAAVFRLASTHDDRRWPAFSAEMRRLGVGSILGFLLRPGGTDALGALTFYADAPHAFTRGAERVGWVLATHATIALTRGWVYG